MKRRLFFTFGALALLARKAQAQIELTSIKISQVRLLFNPAHFDVVDVNGINQVNLKQAPIAGTHSQILYDQVSDVWLTPTPPAIVFLNGLAMLKGFDYNLVSTGVQFTLQQDSPTDIVTIWK